MKIFLRLMTAFSLATLVVISPLTPPLVANAITVVTCPTGPPYHVWGHQYAAGSYDGQFGWFMTYNNSVPDWTTAFSLSHLYSYYGSTDPSLATTWIEVGYYKGYGVTSYNSPHYYYAWSDQGAYHEHDSSTAPTTGVTYSYQDLFEGHNYNLGTDDWNVYWDGLGTVRGTIHQSSQPYGRALAGGEVLGDATSWTQMKTHGTPDQEIVLQGYTWRSWNTTFTTHACQSSGITFKINTSFTDYSVTGQA